MLFSRLIPIFLCLFFAIPLSAQCYSTFRQDGIDLFEQGKWASAKQQFLKAADCKSDKPAQNDLATWISKCDRKIADAAERNRLRREQEEAERADQERAAAADDSFWEALKDGSASDCEKYLLKYPKGRHAGEANSRMELLQAQANKKKESNPGKKSQKSGLKLKMVQGGDYLMGSPGNEVGRNKDECQHGVTVNSFQIGIYEITQSDWFSVMGSDPVELRNKGCDDCPVEGVSWEDIQGFLSKLNAREAKEQGRYRLPTEAEWEFAARGGNQTKGYTYIGGNQLDKVAWFGTNAKMGNFSGQEKTTRPVGGRNPNELGLYDMSGNVWEWCSDEWTAYPGCTIESCSGCAVLRGGSWNNAESKCRPACRLRFTTTKRTEAFGFRIAKDVE